MASADSCGSSAPDNPVNPQQLHLSGEILQSWQSASSFEWIVGNGIGGYASGTLSGISTRRYHGMLMAATSPPVGRTLLVANLSETVVCSGQSTPLSTNQWWDESVSPEGYRNLESFSLENGLPVFRYKINNFTLEKRVWMEYGKNLTWALYSWPTEAPPATLFVHLFMANRNYHFSQHGSSQWEWKSGLLQNGVWISAGDWAQKTFIKASSFSGFTNEDVWYWGFLHRVERERGLDDVDDFWTPGSLEISLNPGSNIGVLCSAVNTDQSPDDCVAALEREKKRRSDLMAQSRISIVRPEVANLVMAADSFLVRRCIEKNPAPDRPNTILAGYHWFGDWGRDTMISLPGITLITGRYKEAHDILESYAEFISEGMLPNAFPDSGGMPEYNTVDATLWYFQAVYHYLAATNDMSLLANLYPRLKQIIECHQKGTRHHIQADPVDGLLSAGFSGSQLTWMDARVGNQSITPRVGKPVEIQSLWYNALRLMGSWASQCHDDPTSYIATAEKARSSFEKRFWVPGAGYLFDVIDTPTGDDLSFRPNQLFAASLHYPLVSPDEARMIVDECQKKLLTPCGLRTLDPADPHYVGHYGGDQWRRDGAYHQGTVWAWLIGPYTDAVLYAYNDRQMALDALEPVVAQTYHAGLGTLSEIYDGDYPHHPRGCISQAWSVAEVLRSMHLMNA